jgi:hypothetical protein
MNNHPDQQTINHMKEKRNKAQAILHRKKHQGELDSTPKIAQKNSTCEYKTVEEEFSARNEITA